MIVRDPLPHYVPTTKVVVCTLLLDLGQKSEQRGRGEMSRHSDDQRDVLLQG